jgi:hypothetical protein
VGVFGWTAPKLEAPVLARQPVVESPVDVASRAESDKYDEGEASGDGTGATLMPTAINAASARRMLNGRTATIRSCIGIIASLLNPYTRVWEHAAEGMTETRRRRSRM